MGRVFVIGPGSHDYSPASKYGELVKILSPKCNPFATDALLRDLRHELFEVHNATREDCLMFCGNPYLNALATGLFTAMFGSFKFLVYGAKHHDYVIRDVVFNDAKFLDKHQEAGDGATNDRP